MDHDSSTSLLNLGPPAGLDRAGWLHPVKGHLHSYLSLALTILLFSATLISNYSSRRTHSEDVQRDLERRLALLEKDAATRREVEEVKKTVDRIENKLDTYREQEIRLHHIN